MSERKVAGRTVVMAMGMIIIILIVSLIGAIAIYTTKDSQISTLRHQKNQLQTWLDGNITDYENQINSLNSQISALNSQVTNLQTRINHLNGVIDSLTKYFFVQDSDFTTSLDNNPFWGVEAWHNNPDSICEIQNGMLHLFYNGTIDYSYGNSGVFQGTHTYGGFTHQLLIGSSPESSYYSDFVILPKNMSSGKFWLETNFTITRMGFNRYPTVYDPKIARVNLGVTLMCAINDLPLNLTGQNLWMDVYFAGYSLNETSIWSIPGNLNYSDETGDIHAGYFVGEVPTQDFGKWISMRVDLGDYINRTLNLIKKIDIKTIRVYGIILFVECLGAYAEAEYDYVRTTVA